MSRPGIVERYCPLCGGFLRSERADDVDAFMSAKRARVLADHPDASYLPSRGVAHHCKGGICSPASVTSQWGRP